MFTLLPDNQVRMRIWTPVSKSEDADDDHRILKGIASTERKDQQGEIIIQKGICTDHLLNGGWINWNHRAKDNPAAIIGKPLKAEVNKDNQLYVEGRLFKGVPQADSAWILACYLTDNPDDGQLGWSVEGQGVRKGNVIVKMDLRHLALTQDPVQKDSWATVVKAMIDGLDEDEFAKAISSTNSHALLLEHLDSNQRAGLLQEIFFGKSDAAPLVFDANGMFRNGPLSVHRQLVAKGLQPDTAKDFIVALHRAGAFRR